ncbi:MAG: ATP cone domain-containing protein [Patescibacteria group bacterium]
MSIKQVYKRDGTLVDFDQRKITEAIYKAAAEVGGKDWNLAQKLSDQVVKFLEKHFPKTIPTVEEIQNVVEKILIENGHAKTAKAYILYRQKRKELREKKEKKEIENIPYKTIWEVLVWNLEHSCETIDKLNEHIKAGTFSQLVNDAEQKYNEDIFKVADLILARKDQVKLLIIAGPSSSGKTTTTHRIAEILEKENISLVKFSVDNYFYNLESQIKDKFGDYDYEGPYALELPLINQHLTDLLAHKEIQMPTYNFRTGQREKETIPLKLEENQIILVDSHFGLYDKLTESVPKNKKFGLYLETLCQLRDKEGRFVRWTDIRFLRRMIRDSQFRSLDPIRTIGHWHYVRRGELKNIIPNICQADVVLNTSLPYELPIFKHYLFHYLPEAMKIYRDDPDQVDAFIRAERIYNLLSSVEEWKDVSIVPKNSILREFIG